MNNCINDSSEYVQGEYGDACVVASNCVEKYPTSALANIKKAIACKMDENIYGYCGSLRHAVLMADYSFGAELVGLKRVSIVIPQK